MLIDHKTHTVTASLQLPSKHDRYVDRTLIFSILEKLGPAYVFCAGVSKTEFQAVCSGVRYVPDLVVEKMCHSIELPAKNV